MRRLRVPLLFLVIAAGTAVVGWWLFPVMDPLTPANTLGITIYQQRDYDNVAVRVTPGEPGTYEVALSVSSPELPTRDAPPTISTRIVFPVGSVVHDCERKCFRQDLAMQYVPADGTRPGRWEATQRYTVENPGLLLAAGPDAVEGALPQVIGTKQLDTIEVSVDLPGARQYAWTEGPPPNVVDEDRVRWVMDIGTAGAAAQSVAGVNRDAQSREVVHTFLAGTLFGVAGGALIAALQEYINARRSQAAEASRPGRPGPPATRGPVVAPTADVAPSAVVAAERPRHEGPAVRGP